RFLEAMPVAEYADPFDQLVAHDLPGQCRAVLRLVDQVPPVEKAVLEQVPTGCLSIENELDGEDGAAFVLDLFNEIDLELDVIDGFHRTQVAGDFAFQVSLAEGALAFDLQGEHRH